MGARAILFAGVAGACVLGVGMGLWARPAMNERRMAVVAPEPEAPPIDPSARRLKIVINDGPAAPVGAPIETLPTQSRPLFATLRPRQDGQAVMGQVPELARLEPKPLPKMQMPHLEIPKVEGPKLPDLAPLMVAAVAAPGHWLDRMKADHDAAQAAKAAHEMQLAEADKAVRAAQARAEAQAAHDAARRAQAEKAREAAAERAEARRIELAEAAKAEQARRQEARLEQAKLDVAKLEQVRKAKQARLDQAKADQARLIQVKLVQAQAQAKAEKAHQAAVVQAKADKSEKLRLAQAQSKAQKAEAVKLAQAEARGRAEARAEAKELVLAQARDDARKRARLEALVHAVQKVLPHAAKAEVQTASIDRKHTAKARREQVELERASLRARKPQRVAPAPPPMPAPSGLVKVSTPRCASHDPGAALVCADPQLSAADRQMAHAYQSARAAGVPDGQLQAQQQRWLAARATAAREAPWAVRDVYLARIAELNGQAREAHTDGY